MTRIMAASVSAGQAGQAGQAEQAVTAGQAGQAVTAGKAVTAVQALQALQAALAAEDAAIFGYGVAGAHLSGSRKSAAEQHWTDHNEARDTLTAMVSALGAPHSGAAPPRPSPAWTPPTRKPPHGSPASHPRHAPRGGRSQWLAHPNGSSR